MLDFDTVTLAELVLVFVVVLVVVVVVVVEVKIPLTDSFKKKLEIIIHKQNKRNSLLPVEASE